MIFQFAAIFWEQGYLYSNKGVYPWDPRGSNGSEVVVLVLVCCWETRDANRKSFEFKLTSTIPRYLGLTQIAWRQELFSFGLELLLLAWAWNFCDWSITISKLKRLIKFGMPFLHDWPIFFYWALSIPVLWLIWSLLGDTSLLKCVILFLGKTSYIILKEACMYCKG